MNPAQFPPVPLPNPLPPQPGSGPLPAQYSTAHLAQTIASPTPPSPSQPANFLPIPTAPIGSSTPDAGDIPPPAPGIALNTIVPQSPPPLSGHSVFESKSGSSLYTASLASLISRNFIAGSSRALGTLLIYLLFLLIGLYLATTYFWPQAKPYFDAFQKLAALADQPPPSAPLDPEQARLLLEQLQQ